MTIHAKQQRQRVHYWFDVLVMKAASIIMLLIKKKKKMKSNRCQPKKGTG